MTITEPRTAAATKARIRQAEERAAQRLRERGWICVAPGTEASHEVGSLLADIYAAEKA